MSRALLYGQLMSRRQLFGILEESLTPLTHLIGVINKEELLHYQLCV